MRYRFTKLSLVVFTLFAAGCSEVKPQHYAQQTPALTIQDYFNGPVKAWGMFQNRSDKVLKRFYVDIKGSWHGNDGQLDETFYYDDGKQEKRLWKIHRLNEHQFTATASDVIGVATGEQYGNVIRMRYVVRIPSGGKTYDLTADDWMYRINENGVINTSTFTKYGIKVGKLTGFIYKPS